jgi:AraC-like DNA-binding protein
MMKDESRVKLRVMDSLLKMMEEEMLFLDKDISAERLAANCRCTSNEFRRIVLEETGFTPEKIIDTYREQHVPAIASSILRS